MKKYEPIIEQFNNQVKIDKDISPYFTLRTSVIAAVYLEVKTKEDLKTAISICQSKDIPYIIIGGGSNMAVISNRIEAVVIRNAYSSKEVIEETEDSVLLRVGSGYSMTRLAKETAEMGLSGLELHMGLPGTVGGAVVMNSKWTQPDNYVGDSVEKIVLLTKSGEEKTVSREYAKFSYGYSYLQETNETILDVYFRLSVSDPTKVLMRAQEALAYRNKTQPKGNPTSGCFFKNISVQEQELYNLPTRSAGYLIEKAGLKGKKLGSYRISDLHANFILNEGSGNPEDLRAMISLIKERVKDDTGIELREEVLVI